MPEKTYKLEYLPRFHSDLESAVLYIAQTLQNPGAAEHLLNMVQAAILERLPFAEMFEPYRSRYEHVHPYYRIYVGNYIIYYVVLDLGAEKVMQVRRFLHKRQDRNKHIG